VRQVIANSLVRVFLRLSIVSIHVIEDITDPYQKCSILCKFTEEFHNKQLSIEMVELDSLLEDPSTTLQLPLDQVLLLYVEEKRSLL